MRHAFAEEITRHAGLRYAQHLLGHADARTTEIYLGSPTSEELRAAVEGFSFGVLSERALLSTQNVLANPVEAPTGIEPVEDLLRSLEPKIRLYVEHFRALGDGDTD